MTFTLFTNTEEINEDSINQRFEELSAGLDEVESYPIGIILPFADDNLPSGYLECDGTAVNRVTYASLFAVCGTTYGVGDGSTTFNLPDLKGRIPVGAGLGAGLTNRTLGQKFGNEDITLTESELALHTHTLLGTPIQLDTTPGAGANMGGSEQQTGLTGTGNQHNNVGASLVLLFMIKAAD